MTTFVLVHEAWTGGWSYKRVARLLRQAGHEVADFDGTRRVRSPTGRRGTLK